MPGSLSRRAQSPSAGPRPRAGGAPLPARLPPRPSALVGLSRIAAAGILWGSIPLLARMVHTSPFVIVFWRVAFAALAFFVYLAARGRLGEVVHSGARRLVVLAGLGIMLGLTWILFFSALALTRVAVAVVVTFTAPVFVALFSPRVTGDAFDRRIVLPLALALAGTVVVAAPTGWALGGGRDALGTALALGSAVTIGIMTAVEKRVLRRTSPEAIMFAKTVVAAVMLSPAVVLLPGPADLREWGALAALGLGLTTFPFVLFLSGLHAVRADQAAVVTCAEPVSAVLLAAAFLAEPLTPSVVLGGLAVVAGGFLAARLSSPVIQRVSSPEPRRSS